MIHVTQYGNDRQICVNPNNVFSIEDFGEHVLITGNDNANFIKSSDTFEEILNWIENHK